MNTPEETKVLAEIEAAKERGEDPFGDDDPVETVDEQTEANAQDQDTEKQSESPKAGTTEDGQETEKPSKEGNTEESQIDDSPVAQPTSYKVDAPTDYKSQRADLVKQKAELMKKLMDGEIDADEFAANESKISDALDDLTAHRIRAETLQEANQQSQAAYQDREIRRLIARSKSEIDYANDVKAAKQFDVALSALQSDADNAGKDYADLIVEAHRVVLAINGITTKGQVIERAIKNRLPDGKPPVTLRNIPAASTPNANGNLLDEIGRLSGQAYQDAFAKLSPNQRKALLDEA